MKNILPISSKKIKMLNIPIKIELRDAQNYRASLVDQQIYICLLCKSWLPPPCRSRRAELLSRDEKVASR